MIILTLPQAVSMGADLQRILLVLIDPIPCQCSPAPLHTGPLECHPLSEPKICYTEGNSCSRMNASWMVNKLLLYIRSFSHHGIVHTIITNIQARCVACSPISHCPIMGFDDEGPMSPSSFQLSDMAAESIVFSRQYPRIGGKVVLLLVHAPHPTRIHHITIPSLLLCITTYDI